MRRVLVNLGALFLLAFGFLHPSLAQSEEKKPGLSKEPLTTEQLAVYQAFLRFYAQGHGVVHVADTTEWLDLSEMKEDDECSRAFGRVDLEAPKAGGSAAHRLDASLAIPGRIALVDGEQQSAKVREIDPSKTIREGKPVDRAVDDAFAIGLLTLSEIVFDKEHRKALMSFSFFCGRLCGHGGVILLRRRGRSWKVTKQSCGEWVS